MRNPSNNQLIMEAYQAFGELSVAGFQALTDGYVEQFLMYSLLQGLQSNATCVEDKMVMFKVLSELSLGNLRAMQPHFDEIFGLYQQGFDGIAKLLREKVTF